MILDRNTRQSEIWRSRHRSNRGIRPSESADRPVLVYYHARCPDGATSAWIAQDYYNRRGRKIKLVPMNPNKLVQAKEAIDADVYMIDVCVGRDVIDVIEQLAHRFKIIDHHHTSVAICEGLQCAHIDTEQSGAMLAWRHFNGDKKPPKLVEYVQDMDLWKNELPHAVEIQQKLRMISKPGDAAHMSRQLEDRFDEVVKAGAISLAKTEAWIEKMKAKAAPAIMGGEMVLAVEIPTSTRYTSDLANALAKEFGGIGVVWNKAIDKYYYSVRSEPEVGPPVIELAESLGGGGHKHAAGIQSASQILQFTK